MRAHAPRETVSLPAELYMAAGTVVYLLCVDKCARSLQEYSQVGRPKFLRFTEKATTNHVERCNNTLRQRVSRLVRETLSFSKKVAQHIGAIRFFICHCNLVKAAVLPM